MGFYDNVDMNVKQMSERCREYYLPEEYVVVMNIDREPFTYTIQRPENVQIHQPSTVEKELYYTKEPETITLQPGQTRLVPAYESDYIIKQLTDKIVLSGRGKIIADGGTPKESTGDPSTQHKYIQAIFQGKKNVISEYNQEVSDNESQAEQVEKELNAELETATPRSPGRPKKQIA